MEKKKRVSIIVADDHEFVRKAICSYIPSLGPQFEIAAEVSDGVELLEAIRKKTPDLVILDLEMPNMNGFDVLKELRTSAIAPNLKVIVLSAHYNEFFFKELVLLGAASYLPKNCGSEQFVHAVQSVLKDGYLLTPDIAMEIVSTIVAQNKSQPSIAEHRLTEREIEVIDLLCQGLRYKEIATIMGITVNTVKFHFKLIYKKTLLNSNASVVKYAMRVGIIGMKAAFKPQLSDNGDNEG